MNSTIIDRYNHRKKNKSTLRPIPSTAFLTIRIKMLLSADTRFREATSMIFPCRSDTYIIVFHLLIPTYWFTTPSFLYNYNIVVIVVTIVSPTYITCILRHTTTVWFYRILVDDASVLHLFFVHFFSSL